MSDISIKNKSNKQKHCCSKNGSFGNFLLSQLILINKNKQNISYVILIITEKRIG